MAQIISTEARGAMVRKGEDARFDLMRWTVITMLTAEQDGADNESVDQMVPSPSPDIRRLLGVEADRGKPR